MKTSKDDENGPGPIYKTEYLKSIKQTLDHIEPRKNSTFGCDKEARAKIQYHGQEKHFYGMDTPGPGSYDFNLVDKERASKIICELYPFILFSFIVLKQEQQ